MEIRVSLDTNVLLAQMWVNGMIIEENPINRSNIIRIVDHRWVTNLNRKTFLFVQVELEPSCCPDEEDGDQKYKRWTPYNNIQCEGLLSNYIEDNKEKMSDVDYRWLWMRANTKIDDEQIATVLALDQLFG